MWSRSTQKKCQLCSQLSSAFKRIAYKALGRPYCIGINADTHDAKNRVELINQSSLDCSCENFRMSHHSPFTVDDSELVSRFVFSPIHLNRKGELKPSLFTHVESSGCSVQRESIASPAEILDFVSTFLSGDSERKWHGVAQAKCGDIRKINVTNSDKRNLCVYDTAEINNPAHAEICKTNYIIDEADKLELKRHIFKAFGNSSIITPDVYRSGNIHQSLPPQLKI